MLSIKFIGGDHLGGSEENRDREVRILDDDSMNVSTYFTVYVSAYSTVNVSVYLTVNVLDSEKEEVYLSTIGVI